MVFDTILCQGVLDNGPRSSCYRTILHPDGEDVLAVGALLAARPPEIVEPTQRVARHLVFDCANPGHLTVVDEADLPGLPHDPRREVLPAVRHSTSRCGDLV